MNRSQGFTENSSSLRETFRVALEAMPGATSLRLKNISALVSIVLAASCSHSQPKALDDAA
jgi:hypothetical protein